MANETIQIDELRKMINQVFDFISLELGQSAIELENNFYWGVPLDALYELAAKPSDLDVGSLKDDYEFVLKASKNPEQALPLMLLHVAPLLREIALKVPNFKSPKAQTVPGSK